jgi:hypothetical protein
MLKHFVQFSLSAAFIGSFIAATSFALEVGDIATDGKGNAFLVVMQENNEVFARQINLKGLGKLDYIFKTQVNGEAAALTVPNHKPFVSGESKIKHQLQPAALVRRTVTKCFRKATIVQVRALSEETASAHQDIPVGMPEPLGSCVEQFTDKAIEL